MKFVWRLHSTIFELIKLLQICVYISIAVLFLTKSSQRTSSQHLPFQSLNSNTTVGHERCSKFIKITTKAKVNCCSTLDRFEQTLHLVWVFLWPFYKKQVNVRYGIGSISMQIASHIHNAANHVIAKNNCQSYFKKFEVLFSRKPQGAIRTDWKIYPCIFYHFSIDIFSIKIFQLATLLLIFSTTWPFLAQCRKQANVIMYSLMLIETKPHHRFWEPRLTLCGACYLFRILLFPSYFP